MVSSASVRHAILSHLSGAPMHGYKLRKMAGENSWIYPIKHTSIYTALHQLAESGLVAFSTELHEGRARKVYSLTGAGRRELESWLAEPPASDVMFSDLVAFKVSAQTNENIDASKDWMRNTIGRLNDQIAEHQGNLEGQAARSEYSRMAIEYGIDILRLRVQLLERAVRTGARESRSAAVPAAGLA